MKHLRHITNPVSLLLLIGTFVYYYFIYDANQPGQKKKDPVETETEIAQTVTPQSKASAAANVAGIVMKEENPFNMGREPGQMNALNGEQFFKQQNRQNPLRMPEENVFNQKTKKPSNPQQAQTAPVDQKQYLIPGGGQIAIPHGNLGNCPKCHVLL